MSSQKPTIIYTETDEAPALATYSLLPIVEAFTKAAGVAVETRDISLAGRILACFPELLHARRSASRTRSRELGELAQDARGQHHQAAQRQRLDAAADGRHQGAAGARATSCPTIPSEAEDDAEEKSIKARYDKVKGSAVNPVLREGNSDRRAPVSVKQYAQEAPALDGRVVARTPRPTWRT